MEAAERRAYSSDHVARGNMLEITCLEVRRELSNYIEDDVDFGLRARIEAHIARCPGCRAVYDGVKNVLYLVGEGEVIELPLGFSQRLMERIRTATARN